MKRRVWNIVAVTSLLLFAAVVWLWVRSFSEDRALVSWTWGGDRYTVWSHWGQLTFGGPAGEEASSLEALANRMSNEDFTWMTLGGGYVRGEVREGTATWEMYARVRDEIGTRQRLHEAERVWLRGLEDQDSFLANHLMLLLAAEDAWRRRWVDERKQPWREGSAAGGQLILFWAHEGAAGWPRLTGREAVIERWHAVLDERRGRFFHGWMALAALALPVAWVARPRREPRTVGRWAFNALATMSAIALLFTTAGLVRSYRAEDQWTFAPRPVRAEGFYQPLRWQGWLQLREGKLRWLETQVPEHTGFTFQRPPPPAPLGYEGKVTVDVQRAAAQGYTPKDERYVKWPGLLEYCAMPAQVMEQTVQRPVPMLGLTRAQLTQQMQQSAATGLPPGMMMGTVKMSTCYGLRSITVPWWVLVALSAPIPMIWTWRQWRWTGRDRRARRNLCRNCGYDLRASVGRCPECGEAIVGGAVVREAAT